MGNTPVRVLSILGCSVHLSSTGDCTVVLHKVRAIREVTWPRLLLNSIRFGNQCTEPLRELHVRFKQLWAQLSTHDGHTHLFREQSELTYKCNYCCLTVKQRGLDDWIVICEFVITDENEGLVQ